EHAHLLKGKRIGLITNHTAINNRMESTINLLKHHAPVVGYKIAALFAPEHGLSGAAHAEELTKDGKDIDGIPIYSLHGKTRRPTKEMLKNIDLLVYDIQDIGSRSYSYVSTLFYAMEEAAKYGVHVVVLDRPNPINGLMVDGPMMEEKWRSFAGYINVPYCHGMTVGELAQYFNGEYRVGCRLDVIPMKGWKRHMSFPDTGLVWIPTSPHIPEASTVWYYPTTGILGELQIVNIGVWYTLPFKVVGAPWIDADTFANKLNAQNFPGVRFQPFHYQPFTGKSKNQDCHGVLIVITDRNIYKPVSTQYLILGILKNLYPEKFRDALLSVKNRKDMFCKVNGTEEVYRLITQEKYVVWNLKELHRKEREQFMVRRRKYLIPSYSD
ncbi:MAG: exo-beta-N-acetylmuramidase NamZ domain-containing protein, partial [Waddliaceae bacterium]